MSEGAPMLSARGLAVRYGFNVLCDGLDISLRLGELLELIGPNGSGKSTLLRVLAGLREPEAGEVRWNDCLVDEEPCEFRGALAYLGHRDAVTAAIDATANLRYAAALSGGDGDIDAALACVGLERRANALGGELSAGESRRLAWARLLVRRARLWLLDEPLANLDDDGCAVVRQMVGAHLDGGGMVVVTGHRSANWEGTCSSVRLQRH